MRLRKRQLGFLLNPYRFAGTTQSGAFDVAGTGTVTAEGASIAESPASGGGSTIVILESDQAASGALDIAGASIGTLAGASIAAAPVSGVGAGVLTLDASGGGITCDAADFDGASDILTRSSFTGQANSKTAIISVWFRNDSVVGAYDILDAVRTADSKIVFTCYTTGTQLVIETDDTTGKNFIMGTSGIALAASTWYHLLAAWDCATGTSHLYINDVDRKSVTDALDNDVVAYGVTTQWSVGGYSPIDGNGNKYNGGLAELYFAPGQYLDLSITTNRRKFIDATGKPVDMGATGSTPTGTVPLIYLHLDNGETANNFAVNRAGAGNMTVAGALSTAATSPSD